ncbi:TPR-like protein, partial [Lanmaoa asiatica]
GHPHRPTSLHNLARYLTIRHNQIGEMSDLEEAIILDREVLELRSCGHLDRTKSLNNLGVDLSARYHHLGIMSDLETAIILTREALDLCPLGHPDSPSLLSNLAIYLYTRYNQLGLMNNLDEAIVFSRKVLELCPPWHPDRSQSVGNLAACLFARYCQLEVISDLEETIVYSREALELLPPGYPTRACALNNLARYLVTQYNQLGVMSDLKDAITLAQEALELCPRGDPGRSCSLNNLADYLAMQYNQLGVMSDLEQAIILSREALELRPCGHPFRAQTLNDFAIRLYTRYNQLGEIGDLEEAIILSREAVRFLPCNHPARSNSLNHLARCLRTRFVQLGQIKDQEELFSLYSALAHTAQTVSATDLATTKEWVCVAEEFGHPSTLLAYETSLRLLAQHLVVLPSLPQHLAVLKKLTSSLAVDAFSACLRHDVPAPAVELLEQGRAVFWRQLTRLRSPLNKVIAFSDVGKTLTDKFTGLSSFIRDVLSAPSPAQHDQAWHLNIQLQKVVTDIRRLPGLSRFLLPALFSELRDAASEGPVIIVNGSQYSCDALVVLLDRDPIRIPLQITRARVSQLSSELRSVSLHAKVRDVTKDLAFILRAIWDAVDSPIVEVLRTFQPRGSRIWWCPTAEFSLLPLHAAGPYRKGQQNFSDLYISSYTPTLTALIRARQQGRSSPIPERLHFIALGQAQALGEQPLLSVGSELASISQRAASLGEFTRIEGPDATVARVTEELSKNEWVHLACHGIPNQKHPFESAFALHDGHLKVKDIMRCDMRNPQFAYLSACHTTVGDESSPDEVIHLASAMQFAGFRSVIGTMWAVDDAHTDKITSMFYDNMIDASGHPDYTRAAFALHKTMRLVKIPFDQRILFVHLGA